MHQLKMGEQHSIRILNQQGWSQRKIARELEIDRETVARYQKLARAGGPANPAIVPAGISGPSEVASAAGSQIPDPVVGSNPAISPAGRRSHCEPLTQSIVAKLELGLTAQRIHQDLIEEHQFQGSYDSVKRFVAKLSQATVLPFRRIESPPGQEAQVDYGQGAWVVDGDTRRRPHLFRVVLSFSRKGYTEVFWQQTTENFIRGLENAFRHFGGVPQQLVIDNLRAAVIRADWFDPELNPKILSFCEHYGCLILPTRPAMPRHKGKVEAGVKYAQSNGLAGRQFRSLGDQNIHLAHWESHTADARIHGTVREQVRHRFLTLERAALQPLPPGLFPVFNEAPRRVHRDGHVEVAKAYYSVPPEYVGRSVWVRWDPALVRVFNDRQQAIAVHPRHDPGQFSTLDAHIHSHKRAIVERGLDYLLDRCRQLGPEVGRWAVEMNQQRGVQAMRVLQGFLSLAQTHAPKQLNDACRSAVQQSAWRLRELRAILAGVPVQTSLPFLQDHPIIRPLSVYGQLIPDCFSADPSADHPNPQPQDPSCPLND